MQPVGFEPQTYVLYRTAAGTGGTHIEEIIENKTQIMVGFSLLLE